METKDFGKGGYFAFQRDIEKLRIRVVYEQLKTKLSLKTNRNSAEHIIQAIDSSAEDCVMAGDLYLIAKDEAEKFEIFYRKEMSQLMTEAQKHLEKEKREKKLSSQITRELKESWLYEHKEEAISELENKKRELKIVQERMEILKDAMRNKMSSIQSQAKAVESQRQIILGGKTE